MSPAVPGTTTCVSVLALKLLWKPFTKALPFTTNNSGFHGCPHKNSASISWCVIGSNFHYFLNPFFQISKKIFWGNLSQSPLKTLPPWPSFPIKPSLGCHMHGLPGNFLELPLILWSQKKRDPASKFTVPPGRSQTLIQERCFQEKQRRAPRSPHMSPFLLEHPSVLLPVAPYFWHSIHDPCPTACYRALHLRAPWKF